MYPCRMHKDEDITLHNALIPVHDDDSIVPTLIHVIRLP